MTPPILLSPALHASLTRHTGYLVSRVGVLAQRGFAERLETLGLSTRMWGALNVLEAEGPITQHALGRSIRMDPSTMVSTIDELERLGMVERRPHPTDRRAHALHITDEGLRILGQGRELARQAQDALLAPLGPEDRRTLHELLLRVAQAADPSAGPRPGVSPQVPAPGS